MAFVDYTTPGGSLFSGKGVKLLFCFSLMILFGFVDHVDVPFFFSIPFYYYLLLHVIISDSLPICLFQWALNFLKKPIVTIDWLHQCWTEHRVVPQESYRVLPFSGLTICVTRIPAGLQVKKHLFTEQMIIICISGSPEGLHR